MPKGRFTKMDVGNQQSAKVSAKTPWAIVAKDKRLDRDEPDCCKTGGNTAKGNGRPRNATDQSVRPGETDGRQGKQHDQVSAGCQKAYRDSHPLGVFAVDNVGAIKGTAGTATRDIRGRQCCVGQVTGNPKGDQGRHQQHCRKTFVWGWPTKQLSEESVAKRNQPVSRRTFQGADGQ